MRFILKSPLLRPNMAMLTDDLNNKEDKATAPVILRSLVEAIALVPEARSHLYLLFGAKPICFLVATPN